MEIAFRAGGVRTLAEETTAREQSDRCREVRQRSGPQGIVLTLHFQGGRNPVDRQRRDGSTMAM